MNPDDDGTTMTAGEIASEEYIGAMQNLCDAVERWLDAEADATSPEEVERAQDAMMFAFNVWIDRRAMNAARAEEEAP